jgi:outer membrane protein assembly factor BamB
MLNIHPIRAVLLVALLLVLGNSGIQPALTQSSAQAVLNPVAAQFPNQYFLENAPPVEIASLYPQTWPTYAANPGRNAVFAVPEGAPHQLRAGVRWDFAGAGALPLDGPPLVDMTTTGYTVGMPVGVAVAAGAVYVDDDNGYTYALNALTGKLIWSHYGWNLMMSNPLVFGDSVFVSTGNPYFNYGNVKRYLQGERPTRGPGLNSVYALDRRTGKELWVFHPMGEAMPTALYDDGFLYIGTGDGHVYKLSAGTGKEVWKSDIASFVSMSSVVAGPSLVFVGGTNPNFFYALDKQTGAIAWKVSIPGQAMTGMGDCTPAYQDGIVVQETVVESGDRERPVSNLLLALDAQSGRMLWQKRLADGPIPPQMETATPLIVDGVVYAGSPVSGEYLAVELKTGRELWRINMGSPIRSAGAVLKGIAYVAYRDGVVATMRTADGHRLGETRLGGAFGPSSPVIVGGTLYVTNMYGWVHAIPLVDLKGSQTAVQ